MAVPNPLYDLWRKTEGNLRLNPSWSNRFETMVVRREAVLKYAWAVPDQTALEITAKYGPIVEMGAGKGYWASLLKSMGVNVVAYDAAPPQMNETDFCSVGTFTDVQVGGPEVLGEMPERTLMLCWPSYNTSFAHECLKHYKGNTVVFVGESMGGCTGNAAFFDTLEAEYDGVRYHPIPRWYGINDALTVWSRK